MKLKLCFHAASALAMVVVLNLVLLSHIGVATEEPEQGSAIAKWQQKICAARPDLVLVGNSTLAVNVDISSFAAMAKTPAIAVSSPGAASAWSWLVLKNVICAASVKPRIVGVFFRDHFLTDPCFRVRGFHYGQELSRFSTPDEPLLERLAFLGRQDPLTYALNQSLPLYRRRDRIKQGVEALVKDQSARLLTGAPAGRADSAIQNVFGNAHVKQDDLTLQQLTSEEIVDPARYRFADEVNASFLPAMIELTRQHRIQLVFIRIKTRRDIEAGWEPQEMPHYMKALKAYLDAHGAGLIDMTRAEGLRPGHLADGDHFNIDGRILYSRLLAESFLAWRQALRRDPNATAPPIGRHFVWSGRSEDRLPLPAQARPQSQASSTLPARIDCFFEVPGVYDLTLSGAPPVARALLGGRPLALQPAAGPDGQPVLRGRCVVPLPADSMLPLELEYAGTPTGGAVPRLAFALAPIPWTPLTANAEIGAVNVWQDEQAFHFGVAIHLLHLQNPTHALNYSLVDMTHKPVTPQNILKGWEENYHYFFGRPLRDGDIYWSSCVSIPREVARRYLGRILMLGAMPVRFPDGHGRSVPETLACPPRRVGPLALYRICYVRFVERNGQIEMGIAAEP